MPENTMAAVVAVAMMSAASVLMLLWHLWALARLFPRLELPAWQGWVPFLNHWQLLERAGLPGWVVLLGLVSFGIVPLIFLVVAAHRLGREVNAGNGLTVLAVVLPPLWAMLLTQHFEAAGHGTSASLLTRIPAPDRDPGTLPMEPQTHVDSAWAPPPNHLSGPPPPPAWNAAPSAAPATPSIPAPPLHPAAAQVAPPQPNPFLPPPPPAPAPAPLEDEADDHTIVSEPAKVEDHTIVVARAPAEEWVLEIDGREYSLGPDTIVGRSPSPAGQATALAIDDGSRVLSKSHARLRRDEQGWMIQDLGSTNGTVLIHDDGRHEELQPHIETRATEHLELGTLPAHLRQR